MWDHHPVRLDLVHMLPAIAEERGVRLPPLLARAGMRDGLVEVAALQEKVVALAREMAPPLFYGAALQAALAAPLATPNAALYGMGVADD